MKVKDMGEFTLINAISDDVIFDPTTVIEGIGDDCAIYKSTEGYEQLISIDTMVEGIHFTFNTMSPYDIGVRLSTANISDIAAMGGIPRQIVISIAIPPTMDSAIIKSIYDGIKHQCKQYTINLIGGDTVSTSGPLVITMTIVGEVPKGKPVLRRRAQVGDFIGVTGYMGSSAAGLDAIYHTYQDTNVIVQSHRQPQPQVALGAFLRRIGATAMNDISDGLASELHEIADTSNITMVIEEELIPIHKETILVSNRLGNNPLDYALFGGEDFQLVFTIPSESLPDVHNQKDITIIGQVISKGDESVLMKGKDQSIRVIEKKGYNHFSHD